MTDNVRIYAYIYIRLRLFFSYLSSLFYPETAPLFQKYVIKHVSFSCFLLNMY